jgi:hypothetical protein
MNEETKDGNKFKAYFSFLWTPTLLCFHLESEVEKTGAKIWVKDSTGMEGGGTGC